MIRSIVEIDRKKCDGCGACAQYCQEGAITMVGDKAMLLRDIYCDGLGDCIKICPTGAISAVEREAPEFDASAVAIHLGKALPFTRASGGNQSRMKATFGSGAGQPSMLRQWPIQLKQVSTEGHYFDKTHLLISADCVAYAYADFHRHFLDGRAVVIGCPKLDDMEYVYKLTEIIAGHDIRSVTVVRMDAPCCVGLEGAMRRAVKNSGKLIPYQVVTVTQYGEILP